MPEALQVLTTLMITWADQDMSCLICIACLFLSFSKQVWVGSGRDAALLALQHAPHPVPLLGTHVIIVQAAQLQLTLILSLGLPAATTQCFQAVVKHTAKDSSQTHCNKKSHVCDKCACVAHIVRTKKTAHVLLQRQTRRVVQSVLKLWGQCACNCLTNCKAALVRVRQSKTQPLSAKPWS